MFSKAECLIARFFNERPMEVLFEFVFGNSVLVAWEACRLAVNPTYDIFTDCHPKEIYDRESKVDTSLI